MFGRVQILMTEAWRTERLINHCRTVFWSIAVVAGGSVQLAVFHRLPASTYLIGVWVVFVTIFNLTWFKRNYHPIVPWLLAAVELVMIGKGIVIARPMVMELRPDLALRQLDLLPGALLFLVSTNMMRFSWRLAVFCSAVALLVYATVDFVIIRLDPLELPWIVMLLGMGGMITYTTRRFERLLNRQAIDLRRIQRERIASLRSLVAGVCHELNNPLGVLRSNAQLAARSIELLADPERQARAQTALAGVAEGMEQATARIEQTILSLKGFAHLDEAEVKRASVSEMIDDALVLLSAELEAVEVIKEYGELPPITCRPGQINQVFLHVLRNAGQAEAKRISIRTTNGAEEVSIEIADDGRGISKDALQRIYDPTFSSDGGRMKMGFGLAASLGIVEDHGGSLEVESTPGDGTTVRIILRTQPSVQG